MRRSWLRSKTHVLESTKSIRKQNKTSAKVARYVVSEKIKLKDKTSQEANLISLSNQDIRNIQESPQKSEENTKQNNSFVFMLGTLLMKLPKLTNPTRLDALFFSV